MSVTAKALRSARFAVATTRTEYTVPSSTKTIIDKFTATNTNSSARTLSVYLVPSGDIAGNNNLVIKDLSVAAGATQDISALQNQILAAGDTVQCVASVA